VPQGYFRSDPLIGDQETDRGMKKCVVGLVADFLATKGSTTCTACKAGNFSRGINGSVHGLRGRSIGCSPNELLLSV
jgi:hypothetical protein